jgi:hypothetical protein
MEKGNINFWIKGGEFHLSYMETSLTQSKDGSDGIPDFCDYLLAAIHQVCIPKLLQGETCKIDLLDDPHTLIFVPKEDMVTIILESEVIEWFKPWNEFTAPMEEWFKAVLNATPQLIQEMQDDPEIYVVIPVSKIIEDYNNTKKLLREAGYLKEE